VYGYLSYGTRCRSAYGPAECVAHYQYSVYCSALDTDMSIPSVGLSVGRSVCPRVYCGKTADWIWMPFMMVSVLIRWGGDRRRAGAVLG